jgi:hypothetical protein
MLDFIPKGVYWAIYLTLTLTVLSFYLQLPLVFGLAQCNVIRLRQRPLSACSQKRSGLQPKECHIAMLQLNR